MKAEGQFLPAATIWLRLMFVLLCGVAALGCKPKIGEDCATSTDCSISGDRLCDITQPGGYCTVFNCEPNGCPTEAACVAFSEGTCSAPVVSTRFRRTFCVRECEDDGDCRGGYQCLDLSQDSSRRIVDTNSAGRRICALASVPDKTDAGENKPNAGEPAICFPADASFDVSRPEVGPLGRDATAELDTGEASDGIAEAGDAGDSETSTPDGAHDASDSNPIETGVDDADAMDDRETGSDDATSESDDATSEPDDATTDANGAD
jgi:hypothetical protein